jgi:hypothetical protein
MLCCSTLQLSPEEIALINSVTLHTQTTKKQLINHIEHYYCMTIDNKPSQSFLPIIALALWWRIFSKKLWTSRQQHHQLPSHRLIHCRGNGDSPQHRNYASHNTKHVRHKINNSFSSLFHVQHHLQKQTKKQARK